MKLSLLLFLSFLFGFIVHYCIFTLILKGYLGYSLKMRLYNKVRTNDLVWLNKIIIMFILIIIIAVLFSVPILLNSETIEVIKNYTSQHLLNLFNKELDKNSPYPSHTLFETGLESIDSNLRGIKEDLIFILNNELALHVGMVHLICILIFIFTIKLIIDKNISLEKVKILPLGKFIHFILDKLISSWRNTTTIWIYTVLLLLLIFLCCSTYVINNCTIILKLL